MDLITAENVSKDYAAGKVTVRALDDVSFGIAAGSFVSFVGLFHGRRRLRKSSVLGDHCGMRRQ